MKKISLILCLLISIVLYFSAPRGYSMGYTFTMTSVFVISSIILLLNNCKSSVIKFEFFFLIAVFFTNFVYALVYYPINPYFSLFYLPFNESYISKALALSSIGVCSFNIGVWENKQSIIKKDALGYMKIASPKIPVIFLMLLFLPYMFTLIGRHEYTTEFESSLVNVILVYLVYFTLFYYFYRSRTCPTLNAFFLKNFWSVPLYFIVVYFLTFLLVGSRTIPMRMVLLVIFLYSVYIVSIRPYKVLLFVAVGALLLNALGVWRSGGDFNLIAFSSIFDLGKDLTINNRSLYVLQEYVDVHGITWGSTMLMGLLSIIPFGQKFALTTLGLSTSQISSADLVTGLYFDQSAEHRIGLGTNIIGDVYVAFGFIGVIVMMYLLGLFISNLYKRAAAGNNMYILLYGVIIMDAIYYPRSSFLTSARAFVWIYLLYMYFYKYGIKTRKKYQY